MGERTIGMSRFGTPSRNPSDPHAAGRILTAGPTPEGAKAAVVLIHGRGASADGMLALYEELGVDGVAAVAPEAAGNTWYPQSFLAPIEVNQPYLDSALRRVGTVIEDLLHRGVPAERIALLGFSQGACLTSEFVARHPRRYGAAMALTGGLIGPPGTPWEYEGSLDGTPVFLGTSDPDPHVPIGRVYETEQVLTRLGAVVEVRRYPGMPHTINEEELDVCRSMLRRMA
jgi:predicted esterase